MLRSNEQLFPSLLPSPGTSCATYSFFSLSALHSMLLAHCLAIDYDCIAVIALDMTVRTAADGDVYRNLTAEHSLIIARRE